MLDRPPGGEWTNLAAVTGSKKMCYEIHCSWLQICSWPQYSVRYTPVGSLTMEYIFRNVTISKKYVPK